MKRRNNDDENTDNIPSIRLKYKGGKKGKSKINYQVVKESSKREFSTGGEIKEEKITIKKESKSTRGIASSPSKQSSQITTKTVIATKIKVKILIITICAFFINTILLNKNYSQRSSINKPKITANGTDKTIHQNHKITAHNNAQIRISIEFTQSCFHIRTGTIT